MTVTVIDWIFLCLILISLLLGLWRGLIYEVFALVGWFAAFFIAQYFAPGLAPQLPLYLPLAARRAGFAGFDSWNTDDPLCPRRALDGFFQPSLFNCRPGRAQARFTCENTGLH